MPSDPLTPERLEAIRARLAATAGLTVEAHMTPGRATAMWDWLRHTPADLRDLLAEVERLQAEAQRQMLCALGWRRAAGVLHRQGGRAVQLLGQAYAVARAMKLSTEKSRLLQRSVDELWDKTRELAAKIDVVPAAPGQLDAKRESAYLAGQEAMRERAAAVCDQRAEAHRATDDFVAMEGGAVDRCVEAEEIAVAIRALEVQP